MSTIETNPTEIELIDAERLADTECEFTHIRVSILRKFADELRRTSDRDALLSENVALRKDAERYRWLRNNSVGQFMHPIVVSQGLLMDQMRYVGPVIGRELDAAIDAAIATPSEPERGKEAGS